MDVTVALDERGRHGRRSRVVLASRRWGLRNAPKARCRKMGARKPIPRESTKDTV